MSQVRPMLKGLAAHMQQLTQEVSQELTKVNQQLGALDEYLAAVIEVVGSKEVEAAIKAARASRAEAHQKAQDDATAKMVEAGALIPEADGVGPASLVVGLDTLKDGTTRKVRFEMGALTPDQQAPFLGKKVGEKVVNEKNGTSCEILAAYAIDNAKVDALVNPQAAQETVEAPVQAEGAVVVKKGKKARKAKA